MNAGRARWRMLALTAAALVGTAGAALGGVGVASAHHAEVVGSVSCDGTVSWTSYSWFQGNDPTDPGKGDNPDVEVSYVVNSMGAFTPVLEGSFSEANGWQFSGSFPFPDGADHIELLAVAVGTWGNGVAGGQSWFSSRILRPAPCDGSTTTTEQATTTTAQATTTTAAQATTTTAAQATTTTAAQATTTTGLATTTTVQSFLPTTTAGDTTTTAVASEGPPPPPEAGGESDAGGEVASESPSGGSLPATGGGSSAALVALFALMVGTTIVAATRRPTSD